jgi:hypothetical protein
MTAAHTTAPTPRTGGAPVSIPAARAERTRDAHDLLRAAESLAAATLEPAPACAGDPDCARPGSLTVVTDDGMSSLCGLHAMTAVFITTGTLALAKPAD